MENCNSWQRPHVAEKSAIVHEVARDRRPATMRQHRHPAHCLHEEQPVVEILQRRFKRETRGMYDVLGLEELTSFESALT